MVGFLGVGKIALKIVVHTAFDCSLIIILQLTYLCQQKYLLNRCIGK